MAPLTLLSVNVIGLLFEPLQLALKPTLTVALGAVVAFHIWLISWWLGSFRLILVDALFPVGRSRLTAQGHPTERPVTYLASKWLQGKFPV
jgi:hypothetical protein